MELTRLEEDIENPRFQTPSMRGENKIKISSLDIHDNNFLGLQDGLDWAGDRLDDGLHWAGDRIGERVDLAKEKLEDMGEAISGTFSSINPFD